MQAKFTTHNGNYEFSFSDSDVANLDEYDYQVDREDARLFFLHDHGFCVCVVLETNLQDALDKAVDENKMDRYLVTEENLLADYDSDETGITRLGNASEPFDIQSLGVIELPIPKLSLVALFAAAHDYQSKMLFVPSIADAKAYP